MPNQVIEYSSKDTFPASSAVSGTASTTHRKDMIVGSSTTFLTAYQTGEWLYDATNDQMARVERVVSNTEMYLDRELTTALSGATIRKTPSNPYTFISVCPKGDVCDIDGVEHAVDEAVTWARQKGQKRPEPIIVDPSGTADISFML